VRAAIQARIKRDKPDGFVCKPLLQVCRQLASCGVAYAGPEVDVGFSSACARVTISGLSSTHDHRGQITIQNSQRPVTVLADSAPSRERRISADAISTATVDSVAGTSDERSRRTFALPFSRT
jgi:hypothetical protein